jgi:hypothetical protein
VVLRKRIITIRGKVFLLRDTIVLDKFCVVLASIGDKPIVSEFFPNKSGYFFIEISNELSYTIQANCNHFKSALFVIPKQVGSVWLDLHIYN